MHRISQASKSLQFAVPKQNSFSRSSIGAKVNIGLSSFVNFSAPLSSRSGDKYIRNMLERLPVRELPTSVKYQLLKPNLAKISEIEIALGPDLNVYVNQLLAIKPKEMSKELLDTHFYRAQQIKPENELPPKLIKESDRKNLRDFGVTVFETPQALVEPLNKVLVSDRDYAKFTHLSSEAILSLLDKPDISQLGEDLTGQRKESLAIVQWTLHAKQGQFSGSFQEDTTTHIDRREFVSYPTREFKDSYLRGQTNALTAWFSILEGNQSILTYFMNPDEELYDSEFPGFISRKSIFDENNQFTQNIVELAEHFNAMSENGLDKNHVKSWYQALVVEEFRNSENGFPESVDQNELDRHKTDNLLNTTSKLFQCRNAEFLKGSRLMQILPLYRNQCVVHDMDAVHSSMRLIANEETKPRVAGVIRWADRDMLKGAYHGEEPSNFRDALKTDERLRDIMLKLEEAYNVPFGTLPVLGGEKVEIINENLALVPPKLLIQVIQSLDK